MSHSSKQHPTCHAPLDPSCKQAKSTKKRRRSVVCTYLTCGRNYDGRLGLGSQAERTSLEYFYPVILDHLGMLQNSDEKKKQLTRDQNRFEDEHSSSCSSDGSVTSNSSHEKDALLERSAKQPNIFSTDKLISPENLKHSRNPQGRSHAKEGQNEGKGDQIAAINLADQSRRKKGRESTRKSRRRKDCAAAALSISCGHSHTMCCTTDGKLYGWGSNTHGQLGILPQEIEPSIATNLTIETLRSSMSSTATNPLGKGSVSATEDLIVDSPTLVSFSQKTPVMAPVAPSSLPSRLSSPIRSLSKPIRVQSVACGSFHTLVVSSTGQLYTFGCNSHGNLGLGDKLDRSAPCLVSSFVECDRSVTAEEDESTLHEDSSEGKIRQNNREDIVIVGAAGGLYHSLVLSLDGDVYSFGRGAEGQLGDGKHGCLGEDSSIKSESSSVSSAVDLGAFEMEEDGGLFSSESSCFLSESKDCVVGQPRAPDGRKEDLGFDKAPHCRLIPYKVKGELQNRPVAMLACSKGGNGSYAVTLADGKGWRWGALDKDSSIFHHEPSTIGSERLTALPVALPSPLGVRPDSLNVGSETIRTPILTAHGDSSSTIDQQEIQIKHQQQEQDEMEIIPSETSKPGDRIVAISAGSKHVVCVTRAGEAWAMGAPGAHLGLGPACQFEWIQAAGKILLPGDVLINGVSCGERHTLLSTTSGKILSCGDATDGKLGIGDVILFRNAKADSEVSTCLQITIPKTVPLQFDPPGHSKAQPELQGKDKRKDNREEVYSTTVGDFAGACEAVLHHLRKKSDEERKKKASDDRSHDSFEDDEDYWGEGGWAHALEMDLGSSGGPPFGSSMSLSSSWKDMLTTETRRRVSSGTRAMGSAFLSGSAKLGEMVSSAVKGGMLSSSADCHGSIRALSWRSRSVQSAPSPKTNAAKSFDKDSAALSELRRHLDSFDGLAGKARRHIMMAAGGDHSVVHIVDNLP